MDQRFWGEVCFEQGVGPAPVHIDDFPNGFAVDFINKALQPEDHNEWLRNAKAASWGEEGCDGVEANVQAFKALLEEGIAPPFTTSPDLEPENRKQNYSICKMLVESRTISTEDFHAPPPTPESIALRISNITEYEIRAYSYNAKDRIRLVSRAKLDLAPGAIEVVDIATGKTGVGKELHVVVGPGPRGSNCNKVSQVVSVGKCYQYNGVTLVEIDAPVMTRTSSM